MAIHIAEEGLKQRATQDVKGWLCTSCMHFMTYLPAPGICAHCKHAGTVNQVKTAEKAKAETEAAKDSQRSKYWQSDKFNPLSWESQMGRPLTADQVLTLLRKFIPGTVMRKQYNPHIGRQLAAYYVPIPPDKNKMVLSEAEVKDNLMFVCCGEWGLNPEWDLLPTDAQGMPLPQIRGWRSVIGIFYRSRMIPFIPDDGRRLSWWQIKNSPAGSKEADGGKSYL